MTLETREIYSFVALAEQLHFSRAAAQLHLSQPALSKQIKSLEEKLGGRLFSRNRHEVRLTPAGQVFFHEARRITRDLEAAIELGRAAAHGEVGKLRLGVGITTVHSLVPPALLKFRHQHPNVDVQVTEMSTLSQIDALLAGRIDVGFVRLPVKHEALSVVQVLSDRLTLVGSRHVAGPLNLKLLRDRPFVLIDRSVSSTYHDHCIALCARAGFSPRVVQEAHEMFTLLNLVRAGIGVSLVPRSAMKMRVEGLKFAAVRDPHAEWDIGIAWNHAHESRLGKNFVEICLEAQGANL
jgi:DNA-binding transcriptional LysR family regulator